ncbi:MAG: hypothetical protein ACFFDF_11175 [Candidatus Odinarchaeota archaeon]
MKETKIRRKIRFGLMCESPTLKAWEMECIKKTLDINDIELSLLIYPTKEIAEEKSNFFIKLFDFGLYKKFLFQLYEKFLFRPKSYSLVALSETFKEIPFMYCSTKKKNFFEYFLKNDINKIKSTNLDFILLLSGFQNIQGEILGTSRYGIWSYYQSDIERYRGNPPCFWEIYNHDNVTGAVLRKITSENEKSIVLKKGYFKTINHSYVENFDNVHFESASFLHDACIDLMNIGVESLNKSILKTSSHKHSIPNNIEFIKFCLILFKNKIKKNLKNLFFIEQWNIGYINKSIEDLLETDEKLKINWLLAPSKIEFFADPFVIEYENQYHIFFEHFNYIKNKANISSISLDINQKIKKINLSLEKSEHLSYPFLLKLEGKIFMIPGEWQSNNITLYKLKDFPSVWNKAEVLINNVQGVDPTLFKHNDLWWLTCTNKNKGPNLRLLIFYSEHLYGPWHPHKKNPVKIDIRSARPAGQIFTWKGNLIRPSQDSSNTYGGRIALNTIKKLTPDEFIEEPIMFMVPQKREKYNQGIHTINSVGNITIIDGKRYCFSLINFMKVFQKKIIHTIQENNYNLCKFVYIPKYIKREEYLKSIDKTVESLKNQKGIHSIFQVGNINHPGISDIDLVVVFKDNSKNDYNPSKYLTGIGRYLFTHDIAGICESHFKLTERFLYYHNINHLEGKAIKLSGERLNTSQVEAIKIQTALEFLLSYFIDISIQLKYRVIKLRTLLQHLKAIKFDLDYLKISSGEIYVMIQQLLTWLDNWFEKPLEKKMICEWVSKFYIELKNFLEKSLIENSFYIPEWANLKIGRNVKIEFGNHVDFKFSGFCLPPRISAINKKTFNLNNRLNSFIFTIPYSNNPPNEILRERFLFFREIKDHALINFPYFTPLVPGFPLKIL